MPPLVTCRRPLIDDVTAKIERVFILIRRSRWMFRRFLLHKAIGDKGLLLILPKPSIYPRLLLGTFVGNVIDGFVFLPNPALVRRKSQYASD